MTSERGGLAPGRRASSSERRRAPLKAEPHAVLERMPAPSLLQRLSISIVAVSDGGRVDAANDGFAVLIGHAATRLAGRPFNPRCRFPDARWCEFHRQQGRAGGYALQADGHLTHAQIT